MLSWLFGETKTISRFETTPELANIRIQLQSIQAKLVELTADAQKLGADSVAYAKQTAFIEFNQNIEPLINQFNQTPESNDELKQTQAIFNLAKALKLYCQKFLMNYRSILGTHRNNLEKTKTAALTTGTFIGGNATMFLLPVGLLGSAAIFIFTAMVTHSVAEVRKENEDQPARSAFLVSNFLDSLIALESNLEHKLCTLKSGLSLPALVK